MVEAVHVSAGLAALVAVVLYYWNQDTLLRSPQQLNPQYDYIVVGGGSAGAVLAARLTDAGASVLLLEAGPAEYTPWYHWIPGAAPLLQQTAVDWQYVAEPQHDSHRAIHQQRPLWPRGKKLGGTSALNLMLWNRGDAREYDRWASRPGCEGWAYNQLQDAFRAIENVQFDADTEHRGRSGAYAMQQAADNTALTARWLQQAQALGHTVDVDYNTPGNHQSWSRVQSSIDGGGVRVDSASALLRPAMQRAPHLLHVVTGAHVTRVNFDVNQEKPKATGVDFEWTDGKVHRVLTNKEIIISAGTVGTPQLLMLSGIGDHAHLVKNNIAVVANVPAVGQQLRDHVTLPLTLSANDSGLLQPNQHVHHFAHAALAALQYLTFRTGVFASSGAVLIGHETSGVLDASYQSDLQYTVFNVDAFARGQLAHLIGWQPEHAAATYADTEGRAVLTALVTLQHPRSTGSVSLNSADHRQPPRIQPNYLADPVDMQILVKGVRSLMSLATGLGLQLHNKCPAVQERESDAFYECLVRELAVTHFHPTGTAAMGADPARSVVDNKLRVHGVSGLRVADASVLPDSLGANTNAPAVLIGWQAADLLLQQP